MHVLKIRRLQKTSYIEKGVVKFPCFFHYIRNKIQFRDREEKPKFASEKDTLTLFPLKVE